MAKELQRHAASNLARLGRGKRPRPLVDEHLHNPREVARRHLMELSAHVDAWLSRSATRRRGLARAGWHSLGGLANPIPPCCIPVEFEGVLARLRGPIVAKFRQLTVGLLAAKRAKGFLPVLCSWPPIG